MAKNRGLLLLQPLVKDYDISPGRAGPRIPHHLQFHVAEAKLQGSVAKYLRVPFLHLVPTQRRDLTQMLLCIRLTTLAPQSSLPQLSPSGVSFVLGIQV